MQTPEWKPINRNMLSEWIKEHEYAVVDAGIRGRSRPIGILIRKVTEKYIYIGDGPLDRCLVSEVLEHGRLNGWPVLDRRSPQGQRISAVAHCEDDYRSLDGHMAEIRELLAKIDYDSDPSPAAVEQAIWAAEHVRHRANSLVGNLHRLKEHAEGKPPRRR